MLLGDQLGGTPPPKTASAGSDDGGQQSVLAGKLGQRVAAPMLSLVDDPLLATAPGKAPLFGTYRVDDEGVPAQRVLADREGRAEVAADVADAAQGDRPLERPRARAALRGRARARRHAGADRREGPEPRRRCSPSWARSRRAAASRPTSFACSTTGRCPGDADDLAALFSFGGGSHGPPPIRPLIVYRRRERQGDAGARRDAGEPAAAIAQGDDGDRQRTGRLQLPGWRRRLLRGSVDDHRARRCCSPTSTCGVRPGKHRKPPVYPSPLALPPQPRSASSAVAAAAAIG